MALHHASSGEVVTLAPLDAGRVEPKTRALVKTDSFEAIHVILYAGEGLPAHSVSGRFTLHCLEGRVAIELAEETKRLAAGEWVYFDGGIPHAVRATEDSSLLLTILLPATGSPALR